MTNFDIDIEYEKKISTHILTKRMTAIERKMFRMEWFQLTSSRRGWHTCDEVAERYKVFQLTSSRRGWHFANSMGDKVRNFNSHPHEEDDTSYNSSNDFKYISTHILTKRMTVLLISLYVGSTFQLTSSRRGWRIRFCYESASRIISTHILTKRMTLRMAKASIHVTISTHILTKRMTILNIPQATYSNISTHILTKRMTIYLRAPFSSSLYFNSHPHEEDDCQTKQ